ncbi:MAG: hypothetical protein KUG69_08635 [Marinosulfonomonas sp.]|nr:hypothetical protein [Marinosulfonomonas sp.]
MSTLDQMDELRQGFPGCRAVALADMSSGIVLCVSSANKHPQEQLDALCATANEFFNGAPAGKMFGVLENDKKSNPEQGMTITPSETCVYLRSPADLMETLVAICNADVDITQFTQSARRTFEQIATEE